MNHTPFEQRKIAESKAKRRAKKQIKREQHEQKMAILAARSPREKLVSVNEQIAKMTNRLQKMLERKKALELQL